MHYYVTAWAPFGTLVVALLMVSRFPYPHFTNQVLRGRRSFRFVVQIVLLVFLLALTREIGIFLAFWVYALHAPIRHALLRGQRARLPAHNHGLENEASR